MVSGDSCLVAVLGFLTEVASHCGERARGKQASAVAAMGSAGTSCKPRAQAQYCGTGLVAPLHMDLPGPGMHLMSPTLAGRLPTADHQGSPFVIRLYKRLLKLNVHLSAAFLNELTGLLRIFSPST